MKQLKPLTFLSILTVSLLVFSSCGLRYSDQGRPLDFLKAKKYSASKQQEEHKESLAQNEEVAEAAPSRNLEREPTIENRREDSMGIEHVEMPIIVYILLAIVIPPLAVGLYEGATGRFWLNLVLAIIALGVSPFLPGYIAALAGILAIVHAVLIVAGAI